MSIVTAAERELLLLVGPAIDTVGYKRALLLREDLLHFLTMVVEVFDNPLGVVVGFAELVAVDDAPGLVEDVVPQHTNVLVGPALSFIYLFRYEA